MRYSAALIVTAFWAQGCGSYAPDFREGLACTDDGRCPGDQSCYDGICLSEAPDGTTPGDGSDPEDPEDPTPPGTPPGAQEPFPFACSETLESSTGVLVTQRFVDADGNLLSKELHLDGALLATTHYNGDANPVDEELRNATTGACTSLRHWTYNGDLPTVYTEDKSCDSDFDNIETRLVNGDVILSDFTASLSDGSINFKRHRELDLDGRLLLSEYDAKGDKALESRDRWTYQSDLLLTHTMDLFGSSGTSHYETVFGYDKEGGLVLEKYTKANGEVTIDKWRHDYDGAGRNIATYLVDANDNEVFYSARTYDAGGRKTNETLDRSGDGVDYLREQDWTYDSAGNVLSYTDTVTKPTGTEVSTTTYDYACM